MCTAAIVEGFDPYSKYQSGVAANKYAEYQAQEANTEAGYARNQADDALRLGDKQSNLIQDTQSQQGKQLKTSQAEFNASQRAALAAAGVTGVTAEDITKNTFNKEQLDEMALRYNSDVKSFEAKQKASNISQDYRYDAWRSDIKADQYRYAGRTALYSGKVGAFSSLLSNAVSTAKFAAGAGGV